MDTGPLGDLSGSHSNLPAAIGSLSSPLCVKNRPGWTVCGMLISDDHCRVFHSDAEEQFGKFQRESHAAVRVWIPRQIACVQRNPAQVTRSMYGISAPL